LEFKIDSLESVELLLEFVCLFCQGDVLLMKLLVFSAHLLQLLRVDILGVTINSAEPELLPEDVERVLFSVVLVRLVHAGEHFSEEVHCFADRDSFDKVFVLVSRHFGVHLIISNYLSAVNQWIFLLAALGWPEAACPATLFL
jgi:hypothetical protein